MPTPFMCHECDSPTMNKDGICDNCIEPTTADEHNMKWLKNRSSKKYFAQHGLFYIDDIREAVDITIGDDGFRSKEVIEILKLIGAE
tara:strand:+ start:1716 stop:1976 length:261 start_codon:yes stop_codon:yes gene_type:complete